MFLKFQGSQICAYFSLAPVVNEYLQCYEIKVDKHLRTMHPPGGRNWQLIKPRNFLKKGARPFCQLDISLNTEKKTSVVPSP